MCAQNGWADTQVRPYGQQRAKIFVGSASCSRPRAHNVRPYGWCEPCRAGGLAPAAGRRGRRSLRTGTDRLRGALCLPPTGGKVARPKAVTDEGADERSITSVGTLISLASLDSFPLPGGSHYGAPADRHSEAPKGPWESVFSAGESGLPRRACGPPGNDEERPGAPLCRGAPMCAPAFWRPLWGSCHGVGRD